MFKVGQSVKCKGYVTQLKFVVGKSSKAMETLIGYKAGRLAGGWALLAMKRLPKASEFEFRGYSYMSGGVIEGHKDENRGGKTAEVRLRDGNFDLEKLKAKTIADVFAVSGSNRLVKVVPRDPPSGRKDYPPGSGVPQWELIKPLPFKVLSVMGPESRTWEKKDPDE